MGNTGNSTGTHLHLEASTTQAWQCSSFVDPCQPLGFPNERGTVVKWDGTTPPSPTIIKRKKFPWALFTRKIRNRRTFF
jgi:murein DD-endopeptidase MepM/ murein hydrolase activator NlpD